jgi:iron complex transport system substrate-binding protein
MTRGRLRLLAALVGALAGIAAVFAEAAPPAPRVVVAGGALTEIAFALGAGDRVVGVDATSTWPPEAETRPDIGYFRRLSAEGVLSLRPDLLLAAPEAGPAVALERIAAAGVTVRTAPDIPGAAGVAPRIRFAGEALGRPAAAADLAARVEAELAEIRGKVARIERRPRALFVLLLRGGAPVVGGSGTEAAAILRLAGAENAAAGVQGYKPMTREAIIAARPEAIVMMESRAEAAGGIAEVLARPDIALTPAGRAERGIVMPGMLLLGFGPRTPEAVARLARALHPDAAEDAGL